MIHSLPLAKSKKEWMYIFIFLTLLFLLNTYLIFQDYKSFKTHEVHTSNNLIVNIYKKDKFDVLKLQNNKFIFFTSANKNKFHKLDYINITVLTQDITFLSYLKGFYTKSFNLYTIPNMKSTKLNYLSQYINKQHKSIETSQIFQALFLAIPMNICVCPILFKNKYKVIFFLFTSFSYCIYYCIVS